MSKVLGKQTVPRAEAWALYNVIKSWHGLMRITIVVDATYVTNGFKPGNRAAFRRGTNGDIWTLIYDRWDAPPGQAESGQDQVPCGLTAP